MLQISLFHGIGMLTTVILIIGIGVYSGRRVRSAADFSGGGKAGAWIVCGAIMGTLVSGQATVGTAQLAFHYGASAWWFTLGSGIGCLILALVYTKPLRRSGCSTLLQIISREYGQKAETMGSVLCSIGIFLSVVAQILAATALLTALLPLSHLTAALVSIVLMAIYVVFGGMWGAGLGGVAKLILLYAASILGGLVVLKLSHGGRGLMDTLQTLLTGTAIGTLALPEGAETVSHHYLSLFSRGASKDLGSCLSLILGVLSTQTYAQGIWSGKSDRAAQKGALLSAFLIPPIGVACILIGLYMRGHCITADELAALQAMGEQVPDGLMTLSSSAQVFPAFVLHFLPALPGGVVLGTLFITVVGGGSGLALGMASILVTDIFERKKKNAAAHLLVIRVTILAVLLSAAAVAVLVPGAMINDYGFLSMGLRGAVVFLPLCTALWLPGRIPASFAAVSVVAGPLAVLAGHFLPLPFDPLFLGMAVSALILFIGFVKRGSSH